MRSRQTYHRISTRLLTAAFFATALMPAAWAAPPDDPTGSWMVEKGLATIRIVDCGGQYWGVVAWEKTPGVDNKNPDPKLRGRPTLGMPVLRGMKPSKPQEWSGDIYNSQDGRTYSASISLRRPDELKVQGCVLGVLCGGETWTRVPADSAASAPPARTTGSRAGAPAQPPARDAPTSEEVCSGLVGLPGGAHERRLK